MSTERWSLEDDFKLNSQVLFHGTQNWAAVAAALPGHTDKECCERWCKINQGLTLSDLKFKGLPEAFEGKKEPKVKTGKRKREEMLPLETAETARGSVEMCKELTDFAKLLPSSLTTAAAQLSTPLTGNISEYLAAVSKLCDNLHPLAMDNMVDDIIRRNMYLAAYLRDPLGSKSPHGAHLHQRMPSPMQQLPLDQPIGPSRAQMPQIPVINTQQPQSLSQQTQQRQQQQPQQQPQPSQQLQPQQLQPQQLPQAQQQQQHQQQQQQPPLPTPRLPRPTQVTHGSLPHAIPCEDPRQLGVPYRLPSFPQGQPGTLKQPPGHSLPYAFSPPATSTALPNFLETAPGHGPPSLEVMSLLAPFTPMPRQGQQDAGAQRLSPVPKLPVASSSATTLMPGLGLPPQALGMRTVPAVPAAQPVLPTHAAPLPLGPDIGVSLSSETAPLVAADSKKPDIIV